MYKLTVLFASNTLLSILHDLASSLGTRHNLRGGRREFSDEADKKLEMFRHRNFVSRNSALK